MILWHSKVCWESFALDYGLNETDFGSTKSIKAHLERKRRKLTIYERIALEESKAVEAQKKIKALEELHKKQVENLEKEEKEKFVDNELKEKYEKLKNKNKEQENLIAEKLKWLQGENQEKGLEIIRQVPLINTKSPTEAILTKGIKDLGKSGAGTF